MSTSAINAWELDDSCLRIESRLAKELSRSFLYAKRAHNALIGAPFRVDDPIVRSYAALFLDNDRRIWETLSGKYSFYSSHRAILIAR